MEEEEVFEVEVKEPIEEENVETSTNWETTISINQVIDINNWNIPIVAEEEVITNKREQILVVFIVERLDTKQWIADTNMVKNSYQNSGESCENLHS